MRRSNPVGAVRFNSAPGHRLADYRRDTMAKFKYIYRGMIGERNTRHEAIGDLAKHGDWKNGEVVTITENCLVDWQDNGPVHLGDKHYSDRDFLATKHGAVRIEREELVRFVNGNRQEVVKSEWYANCPLCGRRITVEGGDEATRSELITQVLDHCGTEWFPPSDWVEDCEVCGENHRGEFECRPPGLRMPPPGEDEDFTCAWCGWKGRSEDLMGLGGKCPNCDSPAVKVVET